MRRSIMASGGVISTGPSDPNWSKVSFLSHFDGPPGSTSIVDMKGLSLTANGSAVLSGASSAFGGSSLYIPPSGGWVAATVPDDRFTFGTGDYTIECWIYPTDVSGIHCVIARSNPTGSYWQLRISSGQLQFLALTAAGATATAWQGGSVTASQWSHIAISVRSGTGLLYLRGHMVGGGAVPEILSADAPPLIIGAAHLTAGTPVRQYTGYIDEVRITKGLGRYPVQFTPPTSPFPDR